MKGRIMKGQMSDEHTANQVVIMTQAGAIDDEVEPFCDIRVRSVSGSFQNVKTFDAASSGMLRERARDRPMTWPATAPLR